MERVVIENVRAMQPGVGRIGSSVLVEEGKIAAVDSVNPKGGGERFDGGGRLLTPGLIDVHTHGICGHRYDSPDTIPEASLELTRFGTTTVVCTLSGRLAPDLLDRLARVAARASQATGARMEMLHLEGPFLALPGAGGEGIAGDVALLEDILSACNGRAKAMSVSPDQDGIIPVIERLVERGVRPFITHTRADVEQTKRAIDAGARHATHFYDVFYPPAETDPGVRPVGSVETILADPRCTVDFVCDGVHAHPMAVACSLAAKSYAGVALITDANSGAGLPPGVYEEGWRDRRIEVLAEGGCRIHAPGTPQHGFLAGSCLTMDAGIRNLMRWFDLPDEQVWAMGTSVPARVLGLSDRGTLDPGSHADLVLWDDTDDRPHARCTWVGGRLVYDASSDPDLS